MPLSEAQPDALAEVYARSLYELAEAKGGQAMVEGINAELEVVLEVARENARFGEFLASRALPTADRARSLEAIFKGRIGDLTLRFLHILNEKNRLYHLPAIGAAYDAVVQKKFGRVEVDVYTAEPLESDEQRNIKAQLQKALGREPILHAYVEPSMIGGVRLQIGDRLIDASIATQLRRAKDQILTQGGAALRSRADELIDDAGSEF
jgi:F-type H+-transporting ATPase subunit delta